MANLGVFTKYRASVQVGWSRISHEPIAKDLGNLKRVANWGLRQLDRAVTLIPGLANGDKLLRVRLNIANAQPPYKELFSSFATDGWEERALSFNLIEQRELFADHGRPNKIRVRILSIADALGGNGGLLKPDRTQCFVKNGKVYEGKVVVSSRPYPIIDPSFPEADQQVIENKVEVNFKVKGRNYTIVMLSTDSPYIKEAKVARPAELERVFRYEIAVRREDELVFNHTNYNQRYPYGHYAFDIDGETVYLSPNGQELLKTMETNAETNRRVQVEVKRFDSTADVTKDFVMNMLRVRNSTGEPVAMQLYDSEKYAPGKMMSGSKTFNIDGRRYTITVNQKKRVNDNMNLGFAAYREASDAFHDGMILVDGGVPFSRHHEDYEVVVTDDSGAKGKEYLRRNFGVGQMARITIEGHAFILRAG